MDAGFLVARKQPAVLLRVTVEDVIGNLPLSPLRLVINMCVFYTQTDIFIIYTPTRRVPAM